MVAGLSEEGEEAAVAGDALAGWENALDKIRATRVAGGTSRGLVDLVKASEARRRSKKSLDLDQPSRSVVHAGAAERQLRRPERARGPAAGRSK